MEQFKMDGFRHSSSLMLKDLKSWLEPRPDTSVSCAAAQLCAIGYAIGDMGFHGCVGDEAKAEKEKFDALWHKYHELVALLEELSGEGKA